MRLCWPPSQRGRLFTICSHGYVKALAGVLRENPELLNTPVGEVRGLGGACNARMCHPVGPPPSPPPTQRGEVPLIVAIMEGQEEVVQFLMAHSPDLGVLSMVRVCSAPASPCPARIPSQRRAL